MPSIDTLLAFDVCQVRITLPPGSMAVGFAVMSAVGAGAEFVSGGGGGGGAAFLWQPAMVKTEATPITSVSERRIEVLRVTECTDLLLGSYVFGTAANLWFNQSRTGGAS